MSPSDSISLQWSAALELQTGVARRHGFSGNLAQIAVDRRVKGVDAIVALSDLLGEGHVSVGERPPCPGQHHFDLVGRRSVSRAAFARAKTGLDSADGSRQVAGASPVSASPTGFNSLSRSRFSGTLRPGPQRPPRY